MAKRSILGLTLFLTIPASVAAQQFDLLLKGGHVIDSRNGLSAVRDVAIKDGKIAAVAANIAAASALKSVDVSGLYVTPGLIDLHAHVYRPTVALGGFRADNSAVYPDGFSFRTGVTTFVDPGGAGWRNFEDMKDRVIDRSKTRVLAFINIVGRGSAGGKYEQDLSDMEVKPTADMALKHKGLIIGVKSAHYSGPEWDPFVRAVEVGKIANVPVMVDFGSRRPERPLYDLLNKVFRPGDIYTHVYGGSRGEQDADTLGPSQAVLDGRKRGVLFDVGHGGGSFRWRVAVPMIKAGFFPDTISSDLHTQSMNAGLKDLLDLMSKFLALGMPLDRVIAANTWNAATAIKQDQLGNLSVGSVADVAVLRLEKGDFGFTDVHGARLRGTVRLQCELTVRDGRVVYDLNGRTRTDWNLLPAGYRDQGDPRWDAYAPKSPGEAPQ
jgi:dihydroorotase